MQIFILCLLFYSGAATLLAFYFSVKSQDRDEKLRIAKASLSDAILALAHEQTVSRAREEYLSNEIAKLEKIIEKVPALGVDWLRQLGGLHKDDRSTGTPAPVSVKPTP